MVRLAEKAFWPGPVPFPLHARRHGAQLPRGDRVSRPPGRRARRAADRRVGAGRDRRRAGQQTRSVRARRATACRPRRCSTRCKRARVRRGVRRRAPRRGARPREGARSSPSATTSAAGIPRTSGRSCGASTTGASAAARACASSRLSNWTELDVWQYIAARAARAPEHLLRTSAGRCSDATGCSTPQSPFVAAARWRGAVRSDGPLPHGRRHDLHRRRRVDGGDDRARSSPRSRRPASPSAARRAPTTAHPRPRWKTASARATSEWPDAADITPARTPGSRAGARGARRELGSPALVDRRLGRRRQVDADRAPALRRHAAARRPARCTSRTTSRRRGDEYVDLALLTDGLRAEREQGITIDVAYRYFHTPRRKFIIADTPGHVQYTRNMVTGTSTADLALILLDARKGVLEQSRRHTFIATLLGVPHLVVCVNKMDLVDWDAPRLRARLRRVPRSSPRGSRSRT